MKNMFRNNQGIAAVEFALALPVLMLFMFGAVEVTRYILINQKVEKISAALSDVVAQSNSITSAQLAQTITAASQLMLPYNFSTSGYAIITSVTKTGSAQPVINWQYKGGGSYTQTSKFGTTVGGVATMPSNFALVDKETVIIAEVYFNYKPSLPGIIYSSKKIYRYNIYKPRIGDLKVLSLLWPAKGEVL